MLAVLSAGLLVGACGNPTATLERVVAGDPAKPYLGKTRAEIVACAGEPSSSLDRGGSEVLVYHYSGSGPVPGAAKKKEEAAARKAAAAKAAAACSAAPRRTRTGNARRASPSRMGASTRLIFAPRAVESPYATKKVGKTHERVPVQQPEPCTFVWPDGCQAVHARA